jgi:hypothetical protein
MSIISTYFILCFVFTFIMCGLFLIFGLIMFIVGMFDLANVYKRCINGVDKYTGGLNA